MGILHLQIKSNKQKITLAKELHAQNLTLIRSIVVKDTTQKGSYDGAILINLNKVFNGFEILSSTNLNSLMIPVNSTINVTGASITETHEFNQNLDSEDIRSEFVVDVYNYDGVTPADIAVGAGKIQSIDLFFNVEEVYDYS